jgi:hypothetical protein
MFATVLYLWGVLIYANHYGIYGFSMTIFHAKKIPGPLGYWAAFISRSTDYRKRFTETGFAHKLRLDSPALNRYSLWRGVVVISVSTSFTYIS